MKKGKNLMLKLGTTIYGYASDCSFNISTDTTEVSRTKIKRAVSAGKFKEYESDVNGWDCSSNYVVTEDEADYLALVDAQLKGEALDVEFLDVADKASTEAAEKGATGNIEAATSGMKMSGKGIITSIQLNAPVDGEVSYSVNIQGTGVLATSKLSV